MALRRITATTAVGAILRRNLLSSSTVSPLVSPRLLSTATVAPEYCSITVGEVFWQCNLPESHTRRFLVDRGARDTIKSRKNPSQKSGPSGLYEAKKVDVGLYVRMDIPGIQKEKMRIWAEKNEISIVGDGLRESETMEEFGRKFNAKIELCPNAKYETEKTTAELKHGVLRLVIPKKKQ